jgi:FlaA1/EpsC-like NDP-sugar epimerase
MRQSKKYFPFLVIGGAGSIGQAVTKEKFARNPRSLHGRYWVENNMGRTGA